jgi:hypothetical protein
MASQPVIGGILEVVVDGEQIDIAVDSVKINLGEPMAEQVLGGHGRPVGSIRKPQEKSIEGDMHVTDLKRYRQLLRKTDATVVAKTPIGMVVLQGATFSAEGQIDTSQSKVSFKFVGQSIDVD